MNKIYKNILLKMSSISPMFGKIILDTAISKFHRTPETITAGEILYLLKHEINPKLSTKEKVQNTVLSSNAGFIVTNSSNQITHINEHVKKILKQLKEQDKQAGDFELLYKNNFCSKKEELDSLRIYETRLLDTTYSISSAPIFSEDKIITGTVSIITDITLLNELELESAKQTQALQKEIAQRVEAQKQLIENQQNMIHNSNLAALGEMGANIAHEINNPLAIILTNIRLLEKMLNKEELNHERIKETLCRTTTSINRISKIIQSMRHLSRNTEAMDKKKASLKSILNEVLSLCEQKLKRNNINLLYDENQPLLDTEIFCKEIEIGQVLLNLLNNATDALLALSQDSPWVKVEISQENQNIIISIIDSGPGIEEELQKKIFKPFFSTKEVGKGTGLGISLSQKILQAHNGELLYDSSSKNTKFDVLLPLKSD